MTEPTSARFNRAERTVSNLIERLPKEIIGQVARMLAQNIAHYRAQVGVDIPIEETMVLLNSPNQVGIDQEALQALSADALEDLASLLAWQAGEAFSPRQNDPSLSFQHKPEPRRYCRVRLCSFPLPLRRGCRIPVHGYTCTQIAVVSK